MNKGYIVVIMFMVIITIGSCNMYVGAKSIEKNFKTYHPDIYNTIITNHCGCFDLYLKKEYRR